MRNCFRVAMHICMLLFQGRVIEATIGAHVDTSTTLALIHSFFRSGSAEACSFFFWNPISFAKYKVCNHVLKGKVIEGKYGKKYVRIPKHSLLEMLYPCEQYAPDRCALCKKGFEHHLKRSWKRRWNSHFDTYLDQTLNDSIVHGSADFQNEADILYYREGEFEIKPLDRADFPNKSRRKSRVEHELKKGAPFNFHLRYLKRSATPKQRLSRQKERSHIYPQFRRNSKRFVLPHAYYKVDRLFDPNKRTTNYFREIVLRRMDELLKRQTIENFKRWESR